MYKKRIIIMTTALVLSFTSYIFATNEIQGTLEGSKINTLDTSKIQNVKITIDDTSINFNKDTGRAFIYDNRTLVPLRVVSESLGANVSWDNAKLVAVIKQNDKIIEVPLGKTVLLVNNESTNVDVSMKMGDDNRCYVPLRFVSEILGYTVNWDNNSYTTSIITKKDSSNNSSTKDTTNKDIILKINDISITKDEYKKIFALWKVNYEQKYGSDIWNEKSEEGIPNIEVLKNQIINKFITDELIYKEAKKNNIQIDTNSIDWQLKKFEFLAKSNKNFDDIFIQNNIDSTFIKSMLIKDTIVSTYKENHLKTIDLSDKILKLHYDKNIKDYTKEEVLASHILIKTVDDKMKPLPENKVNDAKFKAENILAMLKKGEDFSKIAQKYSEDPGSSQNGGDLGYFPKGIMVPEFERAAFSLNKGSISDIIKSQYGYHIIKVYDKKDVIQDFEVEKEYIKTKIKEQEINNLIEKFKKESKIEKHLENIETGR